MWIGIYRRPYYLLSVLLIMLLGGCSAGVWQSFHHSYGALIVAEATHVRVENSNIGTQLITYQAPGADYAWRVHVATVLERERWVLALWQRHDKRELSYVRAWSFRCFTIWEQADIHGGPQDARIRVKRWLELHCGV